MLSRGDRAFYAYEIYDGLKDDNPDLQMATAVIRDGKVVYQSPFTPVTASPKTGGKIRAIPIAGTLALGLDMPAGRRTRSKSPSADRMLKSSNESSGSTSRFGRESTSAPPRTGATPACRRN